MALARWKELCMDTTDGEDLGRFWADVLGLTFEPDDEVGNLVGPTEGHGIAMCRVPEPKTVKHRVHLDVHAPSVDAVLARGASVVLPAEESGFGWTLAADPEGGDFCIFVREPDRLPDYRLYELGVDAAHAETIAGWWADVLGGTAHTEDDPWSWVDGIPGLPFECIVFADVPEPKTVKNRIHWDVYGDVAQLQGAGARLLRPRDGEIGWSVMADPEGNEFCVFDS